MRDAKNDNVFSCEMGDGRWRFVSNAYVSLDLMGSRPWHTQGVRDDLATIYGEQSDPAHHTHPCSAIHSIK